MSENAELREAYDLQTAELKEVKDEFRSFQATQVGKEAGLSEAQVRLFLGTDPEAVTIESATAFADEFGLKPPTPKEPEVPPIVVDPSLPPVVPSTEGSLPGEVATVAIEAEALASVGTIAVGTITPPSQPGPGTKMSQPDFQKLMRSDPTAATRAYVNGEVEHAPGNPLVDNLRRRGEIR